MNRALAGEADVEIADFDEVAHAALGTLLVIIRGALERRADPHQPGLIEGAADQLHADRQAAFW